MAEGESERQSSGRGGEQSLPWLDHNHRGMDGRGWEGRRMGEKGMHVQRRHVIPLRVGDASVGWSVPVSEWYGGGVFV